jgi:4-azaleucine resistance transporter AzlC
MKSLVKRSFLDTLPVMAGYLFLGTGFGMLLHSKGYGILWAAAMSIFIYAGSMQYLAVDLLSGGASLIAAAITTLMVNARHLFYGISMIDKYKGCGWRKPYLIFALTDETYSLLCMDHQEIPEAQKGIFYFFVSLFDHLYWIIGTALGVLAGSVIGFGTEGIDFSLTALFVTIFLDQWLGKKGRTPALIGVGVSVLCLIIFGGEGFLIPSMLAIAVILCLYKEKGEGEKNDK